MPRTSAAASATTPENYVVFVSLEARELSRYGLHPITRTISCPAKMTFKKVHHTLQIAFGWSHVHAYHLELHDHHAETDCSNCSWKILLDIMPQEARLDLEDFDDMDSPGDPPPPLRRCSERLKPLQVFDKPELMGKFMNYEYDLAAGREHSISIVGRGAATTKPDCIAGEGHGIGEDVQGFQ